MVSIQPFDRCKKMSYMVKK